MGNRRIGECPAVRRHFSRAGWAFCGAEVTAVLAALAIKWLAVPMIPNQQVLRWMVSFLPMYGAGIPLGMWILSSVPGQPGEQKKMKIGDFFIALIMCFPFMVGGGMLGNLLAGILSGGRASNNVAEIIAHQDLLTTLTMIIAAPVMEEMIFRKLLIDRTVRFGEKHAIVFSALAFGLFHCNVYQFFYAFGIGLIFGYVYVRTRKIRYTMLMHFIINFLSGVVAAFFMSRVDSQMMQMVLSQDVEGLLKLAEQPQILISFYVSLIPLMLQNLITLGLGIAGAALLGIRKKRFFFHTTEEEITGKTAVKNLYFNAGMVCFMMVSLIQTVRMLMACCR